MKTHRITECENAIWLMPTSAEQMACPAACRPNGLFESVTKLYDSWQDSAIIEGGWRTEAIESFFGI
jgi:hypothetical protein